jgi:hypothetical protein
MADAAVAEYAPNEDYKKIIEAEYSVADFGFERMDYSNSYDKGSKIGKDAYGSLEKTISSLTDSLTKKDEKDKSLDDFGAGTIPIKVEGTGAGGAVDVDMSNEDLQYLRDIAERDYINKFSTATLAPNITVKFGDVHETADVDAIRGRIEEIMREEISTSAEGAY